MQFDQPGEMPTGKEQVMHIPRVRAGTRAAMRVTNRYTMPPLAPRGQQHSDLLWNTRGQEVGAAASTYQPEQSLTSPEEDAWLNDVVPQSYSHNSPGDTSKLTGESAGTVVSAGTRATTRVAPTMQTSDVLSAEYGRGGRRDPGGRPDLRPRPAFSPVVSDPICPGHRLWSVVYRLSERVCQELTRRRPVVESNDAQVESLARECAVDILRAESALASQVHNLTEAEQVMQAVVDEVSGFGPLAPLWRDDAVTEIMAVGPRFTVVEQNGDMEEVACHFEDEQHMIRIVGNILQDTGRAFDPSVMITNARLLDGTFVNIIMPPGAVKGPTLTMRKRSKHVLTLAELVERETLSELMAEFLVDCVEARRNIVICGGLRSGRTTLLNALAALIPSAERIVTIEDVAELQFEQKQVISLEGRLLSSEVSAREQEKSASMRELLFSALRLRPERLVVGDCWSDEAGILLSALHTGYAGSLFNMYANGLQDCLSRLEMMWLANRPTIPLAVTREQVARVVDVVIYLARLSNGARKVMNIAEVMGVQDGKIKARSIFHCQENAGGQEKFGPGEFVPTCLAESRHARPAADVFMASPATEARQAPPPVLA